MPRDPYPRGIAKVVKTYEPDMDRMVRALEIVLKADTKEVESIEDKSNLVRRQEQRLSPVSPRDAALPKTGTEDPA